MMLRMQKLRRSYVRHRTSFGTADILGEQFSVGAPELMDHLQSNTMPYCLHALAVVSDARALEL